MKQVGLIQYYVSTMIFVHSSPVSGNQYTDLAKPELCRKARVENNRPDNVP